MTQFLSRYSRLLLSILLIAVLIGGGAGVANLLYQMRQDAPRRNEPNPPPLVDSITLRAETITERFHGYGTAEPVRAANLSSEIAGRVTELVDDIRAGSAVTQGQALVRLDAREYELVVERFEALLAADEAGLEVLAVEGEKLQDLIATSEDEVQVARNEFLRVADLLERELAAKKEHDFANLAFQRARRVLQGYQMELARIAPRTSQLLASLRAHEAEANLARLNIERCEITAPFAGRLQSLLVEVGERVGPGSILMKLIDPSRVDIPIHLPVSVFDRVGIGSLCRVESESLPGVGWSGEISRIAPAADEATRTFATFVDVDNNHQELPLVPGTFVKAEVDGPAYPNRIVVPRGAIRGGFVMVVDSGAAGPSNPGANPGPAEASHTPKHKRSKNPVARARAVAIERLIGDRAIVSGDIRVGDRLILSHLSQLQDGSPIRIETETESATTQEAVPNKETVSTTGAIEGPP